LHRRRTVTPGLRWKAGRSKGALQKASGAPRCALESGCDWNSNVIAVGGAPGMPMAGSRGGPAETGHGRLVEAHAAGVEAQGPKPGCQNPPNQPAKGTIPWLQGSRQPKGPPADVSGVAPGTPWRTPCLRLVLLQRTLGCRLVIGWQASVTGCLVQWHGGMTLACMETSRRRQQFAPGQKCPCVPLWRCLRLSTRNPFTTLLPPPRSPSTATPSAA
jgi:hypothetical protein